MSKTFEEKAESVLRESWPDLADASTEAMFEAINAAKNWPRYASAHEAYAVLKEEVDEFWEHVKTNQKRRDLVAMRKELIQIAAVALRAATEICDEVNGRK